MLDLVGDNDQSDQVSLHRDKPLSGLETEEDMDADSFYEQVLGDQHNTPAKDRLGGFHEVTLFVSQLNGKSKEVGLAELVWTKEKALRRTLHGHRLPENRTNDHIVIRNVRILRRCNGIAYPYKFNSVDALPLILGDMVSAGFYVWDTRMMRGLRPPASEVIPLKQNKSCATKKTSTKKNSTKKNSTKNTGTKKTGLSTKWTSASTKKAGQSTGTSKRPVQKRRNLISEEDDDDDVILPNKPDGEEEDPEYEDDPNQDVIIPVEDQLDGEIVAVNQDRQRTAVELEDFDRTLFRTESVMVPWPAMVFHTTRLRPIDPGHVQCTKQQLIIAGVDERVGRITVTIHPDHVPEDGICANLLQERNNGTFGLPRGVQVIIVDGHHRYLAIEELRKDKNPRYNWTRSLLQVYLTIRANGCSLSALEYIKNSKLLNTVSGNVFPCTSFIAILNTVLQYATWFEITHGITILQARLVDVKKDMKKANYIPSAQSDASYRRYIQTAKLALRCDGLIRLI